MLTEKLPKYSKPRSFRGGGGFAPWGPLPDPLETLSGPQTSHRLSSTLTQNPGSAPAIGHVPRNICNVSSTCLNIHHILVHAKAFYTGGIVNNGPVQGGGQILPCIYLLKFVNFNGMERAGDILKMYIPNDCFFEIFNDLHLFYKITRRNKLFDLHFTKMKFNS